MYCNSISASKSDVIDECLWKYNLKYNLKIPGFGNKNEDALQFGSFIHKIFELGIKEEKIKDLLKLSESQLSTYHIPAKELTRTKICIENWMAWKKNLGEIISTESDGEIYLDKEADIKFKYVIDLVVKGKQKGYLVTDYKTSKREKKKAELSDDKQLKGYAYAIHEKYNIPYNEIWCAHFYPLTGNFVMVQFSAFQIANWKKKEIDKVWRIRKKKANEFPAQKNLFCNYCEFQQVCSRFNPQELVDKRLEEQIKLRDKLNEEKKLKESVNKDQNSQNQNNQTSK